MTERDRWVDRGAISFEQAERLDGDAPPDKPGGPRTAEVLGYIGAVALFIATFAAVIKVMLPDDPMLGFLTGDFDNLLGGAVALIGAALVFGTGYRFADRTGAVRRSSGFLMLLGWSLATVAAGLLLIELDIGDFTPIVVVIPSAVVALIGYGRLNSVPTQLALFAVATNVLAAILVLIQVEEAKEITDLVLTAALGASPDLGSWISFVASVGLGLTWVWLARTGGVAPRNAAFLIGSVYAWLFGIALYSTADGWTALSLGLVVAFLWGARQWGTSVLAAVGSLGAIVLVAQVMGLVHDGIGVNEVLLWFGIVGAAATGAFWMLNGRGDPRSPLPAPAPAPAPASQPGGE
jgi:hypothetical protein